MDGMLLLKASLLLSATLLGARLLAVYGTLERQGEVAHLIAGHLRDMTSLLGGLVSHSRDFH